MLYRFMAAIHYGYLCMKMPGPKGVISVPGDRPAAAAVTEKLYTIAADGFRDPCDDVGTSKGSPAIDQGPLDSPEDAVPSTVTASLRT